MTKKRTKETEGVRCSFTEMMAPEDLVPNPRNPNFHPDEQIDLLGKILSFQGWRVPISISSRSGFVVRGHGRLMAALKLGLKEVPVDVQDYESEAQEWADLVADNRIAELADMDRATLKDIIADLDTGDIDLELTGFAQGDLEELMLAVPPFEPVDGEDQGRFDELKPIACPECGHEFSPTPQN